MEVIELTDDRDKMDTLLRGLHSEGLDVTVLCTDDYTSLYEGDDYPALVSVISVWAADMGFLGALTVEQFDRIVNSLHVHAMLIVLTEMGLAQRSGDHGWGLTGAAVVAVEAELEGGKPEAMDFSEEGERQALQAWLERGSFDGTA